MQGSNTVHSAITPPRFRKPNVFLYTFLWVVVFFANFYFHIKYSRKQIKEIRKIKSPVLIISSHHGPIDFAMLIYALFPKRISIVVAANLYYKKGVSKLIRLLGNCIPKKQFTNDFQSVKSIKKMVDSEVSVALYPEAKFTFNGKTSRYSDSIVRLIKWLSIPVIFIKCNGAGLIMPKYTTPRDMRKGRVQVEMKELFNRDEVKALSLSEIEKRLAENMQYNDYQYQVEEKVSFKAKNGTANGLERLLYRCPNCENEGSNHSKGDFLICENCGNSVELLPTGDIVPQEGSKFFPRVDLWYDYQYNILKEAVDNDNSYRELLEVDLFVSDDESKGFIPYDSGTLTLTKSGFVFVGEWEKDLLFPIPNPPSLSIDLPSHMDIFTEEDTIYRLYFKKGFPTKINMLIEIFHDLNNKDANAKRS